MSNLAIQQKALNQSDLKEGNVVFIQDHIHNEQGCADILSGLQALQKNINPKYFYDTYGSELFEKITELPEYYPTRTERKILSTHAKDIAKHCGKNSIIIEPGSGSSEKIRLLLNDLIPDAYVPMDIAGDFLKQSADRLAEEFPWLDIHAICSDFSNHDQVPDHLPEGKRIIFYPGSTIGNMTPSAAVEYLKNLRRWLNSDGGMLLGVDMHKSEETLNAAYNDKAGITADFNLNILNHVNRLTGADFKLENFDHHAYYNEDERRIEMHLVSKSDHNVQIGASSIQLEKGETIHTENSYKYCLDSFSSLAESAGMRLEKSWQDEDSLFSVLYLKVAH